MSPRYVVVDGSNLATEGRSIPSLAQLDEAVRAFMVERPDDQVIVVVDASFGYRIDESERDEYEQAEAAGEIVSPPAGAIGRGDGFLLRIADRTSAVVLSNDSFQEFHAEYGWLFEQGRLIGGKPVPGVGWIFTPRAPVRGPRSREVLRQAKKAQRPSLKRAPVADGPVADAIAAATKEVIAPDDAPAASPADDDGGGKGDKKSGSGTGSRRRHTKPAGTVNDPLPFIQFIADHRLGTQVIGEVDGFTSHGAFVLVEGARCYVPLVALGDPPPRSAKSVLTRGEQRPFVVQALDPPRRGIELALPEFSRVAGTPTEETVEADVAAGRRARKATKERDATPAPAVGPAVAAEAAPAKPRRSGKKAAAAAAATPTPEPLGPAPEPVAEPAVEAPPPAKRSRARKAAPAIPTEPAVAEPVKKSRTKAVATLKAAPAEPVKKAPRKKAAPVEAQPAPEPAPAPAKRSRKKAAPVAEPAPPSEPAEPAVAADAPEPSGAPVKKARARAKKSAG